MRHDISLSFFVCFEWMKNNKEDITELKNRFGVIQI